jgi:hypothetical protein
MTTKDKLIEKQRELIKNLKFCFVPVTRDQDAIIKEVESEISSLEAEIAKEKDEPKITAEEFMESTPMGYIYRTNKSRGLNYRFSYEVVIELMEEYANQFKK